MQLKNWALAPEEMDFLKESWLLTEKMMPEMSAILIFGRAVHHKFSRMWYLP